ncbi:hypothetical protein PsorP6_006296 [Peronosclerospora sorghi]|uniref:Uncharacterized protein n=1 Tax=Peronosclerospora sorghi TaxID=230839 RepID=A0ACC0W3Z3_9STRA|nr:hypothetical protein PsorP6_006296 [Peronosclerospora sorghi]
MTTPNCRGYEQVVEWLRILDHAGVGAPSGELPTVGIVCSSPAERSEIKHVHREIEVQCRVNVAVLHTNEDSSNVFTHSVSDTCYDDAEAKLRVAKEIARLENRGLKSVSAIDALTKRDKPAYRLTFGSKCVPNNGQVGQSHEALEFF